MAELTFEDKLAKMTVAFEIERARLVAIGNRSAALALLDLEDHPESVVRLYDILTKGAGNA